MTTEATFDHAVDRLTAALDGDPTMAEARAMKALLDADDAVTRADLARATDRSERTVTAILRRFEDAGLVERRIDPTDPRRQRQVFEVVEP